MIPDTNPELKPMYAEIKIEGGISTKLVESNANWRADISMITITLDQYPVQFLCGFVDVDYNGLEIAASDPHFVTRLKFALGALISVHMFSFNNYKF